MTDNPFLPKTQAAPKAKPAPLSKTVQAKIKAGTNLSRKEADELRKSLDEKPLTLGAFSRLTAQLIHGATEPLLKRIEELEAGHTEARDVTRRDLSACLNDLADVADAYLEDQ